MRTWHNDLPPRISDQTAEYRRRDTSGSALPDRIETTVSPARNGTIRPLFARDTTSAPARVGRLYRLLALDAHATSIHQSMSTDAPLNTMPQEHCRVDLPARFEICLLCRFARHDVAGILDALRVRTLMERIARAMRQFHSPDISDPAQIAPQDRKIDE